MWIWKQKAYKCKTYCIINNTGWFIWMQLKCHYEVQKNSFNYSFTLNIARFSYIIDILHFFPMKYGFKKQYKQYVTVLKIEKDDVSRSGKSIYHTRTTDSFVKLSQRFSFRVEYSTPHKGAWTSFTVKGLYIESVHS